jgi:hypothetical protein
MPANFDIETDSKSTLVNGSTMDRGGESSSIADFPYYVTNGSTNFSTEYDAKLQLRHSVFWTVLILIILAYVAVFAVGIAANAVVVCVITFSRQMRTVTNIYILN